MAVPNYTYLKLKIPRSHGVIAVNSDLHHVHACEEENCDAWATVVEVVPESSMRKQSSKTFKPTEDTKAVQIDTKDASKTVQISYGLFGEQELVLVDFLLRNWDIFAWKAFRHARNLERSHRA
jgi:hypothetical protein